MDILWQGVKAAGRVVGQAAVETGTKGKLQTELVLIKREVENRKRTFGEELYAYVEPLSKNANFFAANDRMTDTIRGPLLTAQREISALDLKRRKILDKITENDTKEKGAYVNATTMLETVQNAAIKTGFVSVHAKLKTELAMVDVQIKDYQQLFGLEMYQIFADLEDMEGWLPTVRDIRSIYDQARRDVDKIHVRRKEKEKELEKIGGVPMTNDSEPSKYNGPASAASQQNDKKNEVADEYFRQAANATIGSAPPGPAASGGISPIPPSSVSNFVPQQMQATPVPAPVQMYGGSNSVPYHDPFASSNYGAASQAATVGSFSSVPAAVQQQQPFANGVHNDAFGFMSDESSQRSYGSGYGGSSAMGNGPALGLGGGPGPTAFGFMGDDSQRSYGSYGPAMGTGPAMGLGGPTVGAGGGNQIRSDPFAPTPQATIAANNYKVAANSTDPFAAFDVLQQQQQQTSQQQQQTPTDNPLFRY